ncbi:hypothetical protein JXA88_08115 [Candidatus Fermentibacteria bacterium]|nr:hypothetical protein [Candidatus Fermentibacteria bacterium]
MTHKKEDTLTEKAMAAMRAAVDGVIEEHRRRGRPLVIWRDGKVVEEMPPTRKVRESTGEYDAEGRQCGEKVD